MNLDDASMGRVRLAVSEAVRDHLVAEENVTAVDFGLPEHGGELAEDELAIRVHVRHKLSLSTLEAAGISPVEPTIGGFKTDVLEGSYRPQLWWSGTSTRAVADPRLARSNPLRGGISISNERQHSAGTLGAKVIDRSTGAEMILSNWHVLVGDWTARPGQRIYQPGRLDGGTAADTVATLTRDAMAESLDAAVATLTGARALVNDQLDLGPLGGVGQASLGMDVEKSGRTTHVTHGRVTGVSGVTQITYSGVRRLIKQVVTVDPLLGGEVSRPGDSGSLWIGSHAGQGVGLHFAGGDVPERALAIDLQHVLAALDVELDSARPAAGAQRPPSIPEETLAGVRRLVAAHS
jgi:endonuclease G, mitochondrial